MESSRPPTTSCAGAASSRSAADPAMSGGSSAPAADLDVLERRLRELQDAYYDAPAKNDAAILEYLRVLAEARRLERDRHEGREAFPKLHLGCGDHRLEGWINLDRVPGPAVDVVADGTALPFAEGSAAFLHSEDLLEHLEPSQGRAFLQECFRVLRPGGVLRLLTPDLKALIERVYQKPDARHLRWCA